MNKEVLKKLHEDIFINRGVRLTRDTIPNFPESQIDAECYDMEEDAQNKREKTMDEAKMLKEEEDEWKEVDTGEWLQMRRKQNVGPGRNEEGQWSNKKVHWKYKQAHKEDDQGVWVENKNEEVKH